MHNQSNINQQSDNCIGNHLDHSLEKSLVEYTVSLTKILDGLAQGHIISYPTEAVFGLGCDPANQNAVLKLCQLKSRNIEKGLILVAANYEQLLAYVDDEQLSPMQREMVMQSWPGPITWVLPAKMNTPDWITGMFRSIAVRVSAHPMIQQICTAYGKPIISTSANLSGNPPAKTACEVLTQFTDQILIIDGELGGSEMPTEIRDVMTGKVIRV